MGVLFAGNGSKRLGLVSRIVAVGVKNLLFGRGEGGATGESVEFLFGGSGSFGNGAGNQGIAR